MAVSIPWLVAGCVRQPSKGCDLGLKAIDDKWRILAAIASGFTPAQAQ